jgi:uncharacterized membrane protein YadS
LFIIKVINSSIYCEADVSIFNVLSASLRVLLCFIPIIILTVLFHKKKTFLASGELPQKIIPYFIIEWKYAWYIILSVLILLQHFIFFIAKHALPSLCNINLFRPFKNDLS